ncbi:MAG: glycosyltransferase family 2 protein [Chloroflexales bacterium]|nr:glycosyltransferase family 2 protein [Chloroflexales bacterium]
MLPRITFGLIVLNGEPFLRYNLRALYPFAHQIIVAEGASPKAAHAATPDGHSVDGTLAALRRFKAEEDPEDKLIIVTAEDEGYPNGFWPGEKDEQSQAYARRASGDWLWQIDVDEFYHPDDMRQVAAYLVRHPELTCLTFRAYHFWGGFDYVADGGLFRHRLFQGELGGVYRRLFRWRPGDAYFSHRPPTITDRQGRNITRLHLRQAETIIPGRPVRMYHYFMVFPAQVTRKGAYYEQQAWEWDRGRAAKNEALLREVTLENGLELFDQHGTRNWLERFGGSHPPQIARLRADLAAGQLAVTIRRTDDIERLLDNPHYHALVARQRRRERLKAARDRLLYELRLRPRAVAVQLLSFYLPEALRQRLPTRLSSRLAPGRTITSQAQPVAKQ